MNLNFVSKAYYLQTGCRGRGLKSIFSNFARFRSENAICFFYSSSKTRNIWPSLQKPGTYLGSKIKYGFLRRSIGQAATKENIKESKSNFQQLMYFRKKEAERSVLLQVSRKEDISYALALCENFGMIQNAYSCGGENENRYLLLEFSDEANVKNLLLSCQFKHIPDAFPVFSRILLFEKKLDVKSPDVNIDVIEDDMPVSFNEKKISVCDLIQNIYLSEKITELSTRLRYFFCILIKDSISSVFPHCDVLPFGSSVNGIGKHGCDLDVMIRLYPSEVKNGGELFFLNRTCVGDVRALQQKTIYCLGDYFRTFLPGIISLQKIMHARMPILKLQHKILNMDCDVSVNNLSAIFMSEVIHFCGEIDLRIRPLLYAVKKWAKEANITYDTPGSWITNFGLTTLVIFFLQNRPVPILPPLNDALIIVGEEETPPFKLEYLKSSDELQRCASLNKESLAILLKEFLLFLATYSFKDGIISLLSAKSMRRNDGPSLWIQYPFEEGLNITKNVSDSEFHDLREKAKISARFLESNVNNNVTSLRDFGIVLGIANLKRMELHKSNKIDVKSLLQHSLKNSKNRTVKYK